MLHLYHKAHCKFVVRFPLVFWRDLPSMSSPSNGNLCVVFPFEIRIPHSRITHSMCKDSGHQFACRSIILSKYMFLHQQYIPSDLTTSSTIYWPNPEKHWSKMLSDHPFWEYLWVRGCTLHIIAYICKCDITIFQQERITSISNDIMIQCSFQMTHLLVEWKDMYRHILNPMRSHSMR